MSPLVELYSSINNSLFPYSVAQIVNGVGFGLAIDTNTQIWKNIQIAGLLHIVVLSGANIYLLVSFLDKILLFVKRRIRSILIILIIVIYTWICGATPSLIRASIMGIMTQLAVLLGRRSYSFSSLIITFIVMTFVDRSYLSDISFILSFSACLGMVLFKDDLVNLLKFLPYRALKEEIGISLSAQILVIPIIFWFFRTMSLASIFSTLLVMPTIIVIMVGAWLLPTVYLINHDLGLLIVWPLYLMGKWIILVSEIIGGNHWLYVTY